MIQDSVGKQLKIQNFTCQLMQNKKCTCQLMQVHAELVMQVNYNRSQVHNIADLVATDLRTSGGLASKISWWSLYTNCSLFIPIVILVDNE